MERSQSRMVEHNIVEHGEYAFKMKDLIKISGMIKADAGIVVSQAKANLVYSRLAKRIRKLGLSDFSQYCALVESKEGCIERKEMIAALTTNVTGFFRESYHFDYLRKNIFPDLIRRAKAGDRIRLWSAACSSGQEPYSMALVLLQDFPEANQYDIRILATDIDENILAVAMRGIYDASSIRLVPEGLRQKWFKSCDDNQKYFKIHDQVRELVVFRPLNLIGNWPMKAKFQVVFCRNVVIYFDNQTQEELWSRFVNILDENGALCIGHSERITGQAAQHLCSDGITSYLKKRVKP